ncbi:MAG TPA: cytochrome c [Gaiellaceae bacterium]|nr:cytochrome c [Gaiellaceae bacterium]
MARRRRRNPWVSVGEIVLWVLFAALLFPAGFAGWAIGHYTSLGKSSGTKTVTATVTVTSAAATQATTTSAAPATTAATTTSAAAAGNPTAGKSVFASAGCGSCHTFQPAGTSGAVGPDLDSKPTEDAQKANMQLAAFVHESIVDPNAYISSGYPKGIMPETYGDQLSKTQLDDLVAFIVAGAK